MRARVKQLYQRLPPSLQHLFHNGSPEIVIGSSIIIFLSYNYYLDSRQMKTRQKILIDDMIMQQTQQQANITLDEDNDDDDEITNDYNRNKKNGQTFFCKQHSST